MSYSQEEVWLGVRESLVDTVVNSAHLSKLLALLAKKPKIYLIGMMANKIPNTLASWYDGNMPVAQKAIGIRNKMLAAVAVVKICPANCHG